MKHAHANRCDFPPTRSRGTAVETSKVFKTSEVWPARARPGDYSSVDPDRPPRRRPLRLWPMSVALLVAATVSWPGLVRGADDDPVEKRIAETARYLSSDELEGRGIGTKGIDMAADYIAAQFAQAGLKTDRFDKRPEESHGSIP